MVACINTGMASAVPTFDPAEWLDNWTNIGGGFARTADGLCLFWDAVEDRETRNHLLGCVANPTASGAVLAHLDARHVGALA